MLFQRPPASSIFLCDVCKGESTVRLWKCKRCLGFSVFKIVNGKFFFFGLPLTRYHIRLRQAERKLHFFEVGFSVFLSILFFVLFLYEMSQTNLRGSVFDFDFWVQNGVSFQFFLWMFLASACFVVYRISDFHKRKEFVEKKGFDGSNLKKENDISSDFSLENFSSTIQSFRGKRKDIARSFDMDALLLFERAFLIADTQGSSRAVPEHLFSVLLEHPKIRMLFLRMGVHPSTVQRKLSASLLSKKNGDEPQVSEEIFEIIFAAYESAYEHRQDKVYVSDVLEQTVLYSVFLQEMLYDLRIDLETLRQVVEWMRIREKIVREYQNIRHSSQFRNKYGLDRAMTAVATPYLNSFSEDLTFAASKGYLEPCVGRESELDQIFRVVEAGRQSVILVGDQNVGKMSIMEGIAERMVQDMVPKRLTDKRFEFLSTSSLLAGTSVSGAQERLMRLLKEALHAKNIILYIHNIHDLINPGGGFDVSGTLAEYLSSGQILIFASTTPDAYNKQVLRSSLGNMMTKVEIPEMTETQAVQVLESRAGSAEYKHHVFFSYASLVSAVRFSKKFLRDQLLPESAIEIMNETASFVRNKKGENKMVEAEDVAFIIQQKTGIPVTSLTGSESEKLLKLEEALHARVIGQEEAVTLVSSALRRARAEVRSIKKPISSFLFLGPTGVGKTELAKTIAEVYFGGENRMVRFDMSEYQDVSGISRLIGTPGQQGTGLLTEAVRQKPFSLVLFDEIEKADKQILDLFLQVFDDGRLTDSVGRVIDFTNTIIIATSNAGTSYVQSEMRRGSSREEIQEGLLRSELKNHFRPEFLNRFDGIVVFHSLDLEATKKIARLLLSRVQKDLEQKGVGFRLEDSGLDLLSKIGFDPEFGARPMRRAIQNMVENKLAELILKGELDRRDTVVLDENGLHVEKV